MKTVRLTMAQALVRFLCAQKTELEGREAPLFAGVFGIFGHGNVTCLGEALEGVKDRLPTWRGQNEQSMALAAVSFAKAKQRRQIMVATSSIGPGATNMVTAAAAAHANRLPVLLLSGDTFANRFPDPVLQQVEHFEAPSTTVNDAFRAVSRYWDRIVRPEQILQSLPQAVAALTDPADCGPVFLGLAQDAQGEAFDYPEAFFMPRLHRIRRIRPDRGEIAAAAALLAKAQRPLIVAGGGVLYSQATRELAEFAERRRIPVVETIAGRGVLVHEHPMNAGPIGVIGASSANALAGEADVVVAIGTRLQDFTTGSWTVFGNPDFRLVAVNTARFDAVKHLALPVVGDARESVGELDAVLGDYQAPQPWAEHARKLYAGWNATVDALTAPPKSGLPSYAQVVAAVNRKAGARDRVVTAAGGLPGELTKNWRVKSPATFDCEFGYSCMGYEIAGGWGAKMATPDADVIVLVGDGSYLMMNSDIYSSVLSGHKMIVVVCDNGGYAVINRLQNYKGSASFNNMLSDCRVSNPVAVDFVKHAESMGAIAESVDSIGKLEVGLERAKRADRTCVIVIRTEAFTWTPGDAWWDVGVPQVSARESVRKAYADHAEAKKKQRLGV
ncbi:MAG TPA: 3D-(3,5/4)-trihydroxycyclohexane-1,2-dione acylhydrolase (decyclizing) [Burkholderiales bacterium]|nr:3D-(3,5/4)-trihydroxycyclohexane-1,2-dione acylhydrolase (decyclizing) [Burkholderiales bacterium]